MKKTSCLISFLFLLTSCVSFAQDDPSDFFDSGTEGMKKNRIGVRLLEDLTVGDIGISYERVISKSHKFTLQVKIGKVYNNYGNMLGTAYVSTGNGKMSFMIQPKYYFNPKEQTFSNSCIGFFVRNRSYLEGISNPEEVSELDIALSYYFNWFLLRNWGDGQDFLSNVHYTFGIGIGYKKFLKGEPENPLLFEGSRAIMPIHFGLGFVF
jgi:hypothetical protein